MPVAARLVEPEWLDVLPSADPRAMRSRRDLRRVNLIMRQPAIMLRLLRRHCRHRRPRSIVELGCGDGTFLLWLARRLAPHWSDVSVTVVDRQDTVDPATLRAIGALGWRVTFVRSDVLDFLHSSGRDAADVVMANLFLHHFEARDLSRLFERIADATGLFVACEPRRSTLALAASRLLWAIGCNDVSRHDAFVSVRAGFRERELSALWPSGSDLALTERPAGLFTHSFVAAR